jgi:hypothetical protein
MNQNPKKPKAVLVIDKATIQLCTDRVQRHRDDLAASKEGYKPGLGSYALYGVRNGSLRFIGDASTTADFNPIITAKAKSTALEVSDWLVEWRESGRAESRKVQVLVWEAGEVK